MMGKLLTSMQMGQADRRTIEELGLPGVVLMENAGAGVCEVLKQRFADWQKSVILILAGGGNNGGDGFVIARRLFQEGGRVVVLLLARESQLTGDALTHFQVYKKLGGNVRRGRERSDLDSFDTLLGHTGLVVDAVFGTGLQRPVEGLIAEIFRKINHSGKPVLAVDLPSGVSADNGHVLGEALRATWTVTFATEKMGHRTYPGAGLCGEVLVVPIGIPSEYIHVPEHTVSRNLPQDLLLDVRIPDGHKGTFGHLMVLAGSVGKEGAAALTALGALRMGPGLVTVATPHAARSGVGVKLIEAMTIPLPNDETGLCMGEGAMDAIVQSGIHPSALAMGPGLGSNHWIYKTLDSLINHFDVPVVLDADALNALVQKGAQVVEWVKRRTSPLVMTPHPGELARLLETTTATIQADRLGCALKVAVDWNVWLVLKGAGTVIAAPDGRAWINDSGNSGMASGGSGDLLTGIIGGLLAQQWPVESAVCMGVWLHGAAGDAAACEGGEVGMMASDLLVHLRRLRNRLD